MPCSVSTLPPACHPIPLHNRSTRSRRPAFVRPGAYLVHCAIRQLSSGHTGSFHAVHPPLACSFPRNIRFSFLGAGVSGMPTESPVEGTPPTFFPGADVSVMSQKSTTCCRVTSIPPFYVRTLPRGFLISSLLKVCVCVCVCVCSRHESIANHPRALI